MDSIFTFACKCNNVIISIILLMSIMLLYRTKAAKVIWRKETSLGSCRHLLSYSPGGRTRHKVGSSGVHLDPILGNRRSSGRRWYTIRNSGDGFLKTLRCGHCIHMAAICYRVSTTLISTGVGNFGQNLGRKG